MTDADIPARERIGSNEPPEELDNLTPRLERAYSDLIAEAADLELEAFDLPEAPDTEQQCAALVNFVGRAKNIRAKAEGKRVEEKEPYLENGRRVDAFFKGIQTPLDQRITSLTSKISAFQRAQAEREAAERRQREREERDRAEEARRTAEEARRKAEEEERRAREEAARIRSAADAQERDEAEQRMREAGQAAAQARDTAEEATKEAAQADREADVHGKAATGRAGQQGKITASGATAGQTKFWNHRITDAVELFESLGPLGPHFSNDAVAQAINSAKRHHVNAGTIDGLHVPGVEFFEDVKTNIRTARR